MIEIFRIVWEYHILNVIHLRKAQRQPPYAIVKMTSFSIQLWLLAVNGKAGHFDDWDGVYLDFLYSFLNIENAVMRLKSKISNEYLLAVQAYCQGVNEFAISHEGICLRVTHPR